MTSNKAQTLTHSIHRNITFQELQQLQAQHTERLIQDPTYLGHVLLCELQPVITVGRQQELGQKSMPEIIDNNQTSKTSVNQKNDTSIPIVAGDRGGMETWHGPGQWVVFVVARLHEWLGSEKLGVRGAIHKYLHTAQQAAVNFNIETMLDLQKDIGLWSPDRTLKYASVGIRVRRGILQSGLSLNVYPTQNSFLGINPCGIQNARPGFLISSVANLKTSTAVATNNISAQTNSIKTEQNQTTSFEPFMQKAGDHLLNNLCRLGIE